MIHKTTTAVIARSASDEAIQDSYRLRGLSHRLRGPWIASLALAMTGSTTTGVIPGRTLARTRNLAPHIEIPDRPASRPVRSDGNQ